MNRNQIRPIAGMLTAILIVGGVISLYLLVSPDDAEMMNASEPAFNELSDEEKLDHLFESDQRRVRSQSQERADLYGNVQYCDRIENDSLRARCQGYADGNESVVTTTRSGESTLEPLQNVSVADERRFDRAELYGDEAYCDEITDRDLRAYCYGELQD